jgi:hypothetical protein
MTMKADRIDMNANGVYINDVPIINCERGRWTPNINWSQHIGWYDKNEGWYLKVGQAVTVGFYIKANCASGGHEQKIEIYNLPFTPMWSAAGGGMCSGAYISAGFNFQCFAVEEGGDCITTRVQACNNTSSTNLSTSASGCFHPYGGGQVTLSGTITYYTNQ